MEEFGFDKNPLHLACVLGDLNQLAELIAEGADLCAVIGDRKSTLLHIAAEYAHVSIMEILLKTTAVRHILTLDHEGDTPMHIATNNIDVFGLLYNNWKHPNMHVDDLLNGKKRTLLHYAAGKGDIDVVKFLLDEEANKFARDRYGATPFHFAARCGSVPVMKELLGNDVDLVDEKERTALHYASWNGRTEAVKWLLKEGASLNKADINGDTALHWAARSQHLDVLDAILMKPDVDLFAANKAGELPLSLALHNPKGAANAELLKRIRTVMENSNSLPRQRYSIYMARYKDGATLLHYAAACGKEEDLDCFFKQARMVTVRNKDGKDSNFVAIVNSKDNNGNNPFHWAAMSGNSRVMEALMFYKVDPFPKNKEGKTPFLLALINNHLDFAKNLVKCSGKDLTDGMWMEDIRMWTDTFIDESLIGAFKSHMRKFFFMPGGLQDKDIKKEMPFIYKALYAKEEEGTTNFIQEISNVNKAGKLTGRTALHWATIFNQKEIVSKLCKQYSKDLVASIADKEGKTPLDYANNEEILRELMTRPDIKSYARKRYGYAGRYMERYVSACNAILVSAALIVSVTFAGWLHPPFNESFHYAHRHPALTMFWIFNGSSFYCAIATVVAAASALIPTRYSIYLSYEGIPEGVKSIRRSLNYAAALLTFSIIFVFCAFAAASFVVLPQSSSYRIFMWGIIGLGGGLFLWFIWRYLRGLYKVHFRPSYAMSQPAKCELHMVLPPKFQLNRSRPSSLLSDGYYGYEFGTRHEYLPWDDGL